MPKPIHGVNGSGMHVHQSLFRGDANAFFSADNADHLSDVAKGFIAGQLRHMREICALLNQYVNSFKRLVPGFEAPVHISWAHRNRTALIRVPLYMKGKESTVRAELRNPDPAANPYLAFAVMLAAGLEGIEQGYELPAPVEPNIYKMSAEEREALGLTSLPDTLYEAVQETQKSDLVHRMLGDHVFERFITNKLNEWYEYREQVTRWEIQKYLGVM
jgi:glutamine synthetase